MVFISWAGLTQAADTEEESSYNFTRLAILSIPRRLARVGALLAAPFFVGQGKPCPYGGRVGGEEAIGYLSEPFPTIFYPEVEYGDVLV
jgi:hypothetical protein